jgi:hypothetical protein
VVLFRNRIILSLYSLPFDSEGLILSLDHLIFLIVMMVLLNLILEMDLNRIDDLQERVIGVDHVSMNPVRRDLLYSGAGISLSLVNVTEGDIQHMVYSFFLPLYLCMSCIDSLDA